MHPDKKVGFALGILLIGIVGAFFFRNEVPDPNQSAPALASGSELDKRIRHQHHSPYLPEAEKSKQAPSVPEITDVFATDVVPRPAGSVPEPIRTNEPGTARLQTPGSSSSNDGRADANHADGSSRREPVKPPAFHEVVAGDTLSSISLKYLGTNRRFHELYEFNKDVLRSPNDLRLGMKLKIPGSEATSSPPVSNSSTSPTRPASGSATTMATPETGSSPLPPSPPPDSVEPQVLPPAEPPPKPSFVRPKTAPPRPPTRPAKSLTQSAPPGTPVVDGLDPRRDPAVLASRPKPDEDQRATTKERTVSN